MTDEIEGLPPYRHNTLSEPFDVSAPLSVADQDCKLIASKPGHGIGIPYDRAQPCGENANEKVAHSMPQRIVDKLEPIKVNRQNRERVPAPHPGKGMIEAIIKQRAVGEAGEHVMKGKMLRLCFACA